MPALWPAHSMVFTHLPSTVLLILIVLLLRLLQRQLFYCCASALADGRTDTTDLYTIALVAPEERTAVASVTSLARSVGSATSPVFAGPLLQDPLAVLGLPFILAGMLRSAYDLTLWSILCLLRLREE